MNLVVHQNITIHSLKIGSVSNASVLQIGTAGIIKCQSNMYNTGGYTENAPQMIGTQALSQLAPLPPPS